MDNTEKLKLLRLKTKDKEKSIKELERQQKDFENKLKVIKKKLTVDKREYKKHFKSQMKLMKIRYEVIFWIHDDDKSKIFGEIKNLRRELGDWSNAPQYRDYKKFISALNKIDEKYIILDIYISFPPSKNWNSYSRTLKPISKDIILKSKVKSKLDKIILKNKLD